MKVGNCSRCSNKLVFESAISTKDLITLPEKKFGSFYVCDRCKTLWYLKDDSKKAIAYDSSISDYVLEWATRNLLPTDGMNTILKQVGNISNAKGKEVYPVSVVLKDGSEHPCAMIQLLQEPPPSLWFESKKFQYLDQVKEVKPSPYLFPMEIVKAVYNAESLFDTITIQDEISGEHFRIGGATTVFMPAVFQDKRISIVKKKISEVHGQLIAEWHDRRPEMIWYFQKPPEVMYVWGDQSN